MADALEQMGSSATGDAQTIMNALAGLSATQACQAYTSMSPVGNAAFIDTSIAGMTQYMKTMTQHMGSIRTGISQGGSARSGDPVLLAAVETATVSDTAPPLFALGNASPLIPDKKWGVWGMGAGIWGDRKADNIASQYDYSLGGFSLGMDRRLSDRFMTGVSVGYSHTNLAFDHLVNTGNADSYKMAIYGDYDAGPWYADAIISYATNDYDTERVITVGSLTRTATGNFTGKETSAYMEGGYEILYNRFHIQSLASLQLTHIALDDYTENGAGVLNLAVGSKSTNSCLGSFGLRIFRPTKAASNLLLSPEARILWAHEFSNDDRAINAGFAGVPASSFVVAGDKPVNDSVLFGLGLNALYKESFNLYLNYDVNLGRDHSQHALVAGMKYMWD